MQGFSKVQFPPAFPKEASLTVTMSQYACSSIWMAYWLCGLALSDSRNWKAEECVRSLCRKKPEECITRNSPTGPPRQR